MNRKSNPFLLLLAILLSFGLTYGQDSLGAKPKKARTLEDYRRRTLQEIMIERPGPGSLGNKEETMVVTSDFVPTRVRATYTGSARPIPQIKKEVIRQWSRLYAGSIEFYTKPYESEMLFIESGKKYWIAVKKKDLPLLKQLLRQGKIVDLFLIRMGSARVSKLWELVLLSESFQKPSQAKNWKESRSPEYHYPSSTRQPVR